MTCPIIVFMLLSIGAAQAASAGSIRIKTDAPGAEVFLDGTRAGQTPLSLTDVPPGTHELRFVKEGFREATRSVNVPATGSLRLFVVLEAIEGPLPAVPRTFHAFHRHGVGLCTGTLTVAKDGLHYRSEDDEDDNFDIPWSSITTMARGMGFAVGRSRVSAEYTGLRLDTSQGAFGFIAYEQTAKVAAMPPGERADAVTVDSIRKPMQELFDAAWRLWRASRKAGSQPSPGTSAR
jgi:hypothetical protein